MSERIYQTIQVVPVDEVREMINDLRNELKLEFAKLYAPINKTILNNRQVAEMLGCSERTVYNLKLKGEIGIVQNGKRITRICDVEDYKRIEGRV